MGDTAVQVCPHLPRGLLCLDQARPAQPDLGVLLSTEDVAVRAPATDRGSNTEKKVMISPSDGVLQGTPSLQKH